MGGCALPRASPLAGGGHRGSHPGCQSGVGWLPLAEVAARRAPVDDTPVCASLDWSGSEDDYDVALEGDHHRQDVARSKRTHNPSTPARRRCASRAALPPRPSHRSAPRRKLTSSSCCARVSSVLRVVGLAVVSVVAGRASGTLRVRITTSRGARRLAIVAAASQPGGCRGVKIGSQGGCRGPATWLPGRPGVAARVAAASQSPLCICAGYQIWGRNLTRTDQTGVQPPTGAPGRGAQRPGRLPGGQQPPKPEKVTTYGAPVPSVVRGCNTAHG